MVLQWECCISTIFVFNRCGLLNITQSDHIFRKPTTNESKKYAQFCYFIYLFKNTPKTHCYLNNHRKINLERTKIFIVLFAHVTVFDNSRSLPKMHRAFCVLQCPLHSAHRSPNSTLVIDSVNVLFEWQMRIELKQLQVKQ